MKVLLLNDLDIHGGAARAMQRLHRGLLDIGEESNVLVNTKSRDDATVIKYVNPRIKILLNKTYQHYIRFIKRIPAGSIESRFLPRLITESILQKINEINPDIINIHWISEGFIKIETLGKIYVPIIWTLHDMWAFTGGCNYDQGCGRYKLNCGCCPMLKSTKDKDLSRNNYLRKLNIYRKINNLTIVTPSQWLANTARESSLFSKENIMVIPSGINAKMFKPVNKKFARNLLNLPLDKKIILFGAVGAMSDERKGYSYLLSSLKTLKGSNIELAVFGGSKQTKSDTVNIKTHFFGQLRDDISLVLLYSAADVMVVPSLQENLSLTIMESLACGTPVVAFNIGGNGEMIDHKGNGFLAEAFDPGDLGTGINWILNDGKRACKLSINARNTVLENFTTDICAERYLNLYKEKVVQSNKKVDTSIQKWGPKRK